MTQGKITIGSPVEWEIFKKSHPLFLEKLEPLYSTLEKVFLRTSSSDNPADRVVFYLGRLCVEDFNEVTVLCGNGCGIGALKILRGLYERAVSLGYIAKNPNKAEDFLGYNDVHRGKMLNHISNVIDIKKHISDDSIKKIQEAYKIAKGKYQETVCKKCGTTRTKFSWSDLDTLSMAKIVGLDKLYFHCYYEPTLQAHATVTSLTARLLLKDDGGITFNEGAQHKEAKQALTGAHNIIIRVIVFQNEYFKLDMEDEVKDRLADYQEAWN